MIAHDRLEAEERALHFFSYLLTVFVSETAEQEG